MIYERKVHVAHIFIFVNSEISIKMQVQDRKGMLKKGGNDFHLKRTLQAA